MTNNIVEFFISARDLKLDENIDSEILCEIYEIYNKDLKKINLTNWVKCGPNPSWKVVRINFSRERENYLSFRIYIYAAYAEYKNIDVALIDLLRAGTSQFDLSHGGTLIITAENLKESNNHHKLQFRGIKLDKKDFFGKSDPYLILYRNIGSIWKEVYRTEIVKNTLNPKWHPLKISEQKICNSNRLRPIKVECYDWNRIGSHNIIGVFETNYAELTTVSRSFVLINPSTNKKAGIIEVLGSQHAKKLLINDYLRSGVQISLLFAIDFSEKLDRSEQSYHCKNKFDLGLFGEAVYRVGDMMKFYDKNEDYPVFGFGGIPNGEDEVNNCFELERGEISSHLHGLQKVVDLYAKTSCSIIHSESSKFHHVIDRAISIASSTPPHSVYYVLLIFTLEHIDDEQETINSIVRASHLPISIIILCGEATKINYSLIICNEKKLVDKWGNEAKRKNVQVFEVFNYFDNSAALITNSKKEFPKQLCKFMRSIDYPFYVPEEIESENIEDFEES